MINFFRHLPRLIRILCIFIKHRITFPLKHNNKKNLVSALEELGPIFIKLGQSLSVRPDLIGEELSAELGYLRDRLPSFSYNEAKKIIEKDFGKSIEDLFDEFEQTPAAAASIAQVHKAKTKEGKIVAVKIRRPAIENKFKKDIKLFYWIASLAEKASRKYKRLRLKEVIRTLEQHIQIELDLRLEAAAASELKDNNKDTNIYIPEVDWELTSERVFTSEWIEGISIYETAKLKREGYNLDKIASTVAIMFFNQAFEHGCFHADLHHGNIFIDKSSRVVLVDFGIIGRLKKADRTFVAEILHGFLNRDYKKVAKVHIQAGYVPKDKSIDLFAQRCRAIGEPIVGRPIDKISLAKLLSLLFKITEEFEMATQPQLVLLQKTMVLVEGIGYSLNPKTNMWMLAEPWIKEWATYNLGFDAKLKDIICNLTEEFLAKLSTKH